MWKCKECSHSFPRRFQLLKHYRLYHQQYGRRYLCIYENCPCSSKTWNALLSHICRCHPSPHVSRKDISTFICSICNCTPLSTENDFFHHIGQHLKNHELVTCIFLGCSHQTNSYGSFHTHKWRKHNTCTVKDFKPEVLGRTSLCSSVDLVSNTSPDVNEDLICQDSAVKECTKLTKDIELKFASFLLKLENSYLVSSVAINELLQEFHYLFGSASVSITEKTIGQILGVHNCEVDTSVIQELASALCTLNPIQAAIGKDGPLSTPWKRKKYYKHNFNVVEPVECIIDLECGKSFQYIPILENLQTILKCEHVISAALNLKEKYQPVQSDKQVYKIFCDGQNFKRNALLSHECAVSLILYIDEFEICNPLGTSRKKHKICALYWVLGNLPSGYHSSLSSIHLAALINSKDLKNYGYERVLEPLVSDLVTLEKHGVFVARLGKCIKGTVQCVVADNLGAHSIAGFTENFSSGYVCRFCTGQRFEFQTKEVGSGAFSLRTEEMHREHLKTLEESLDNHFGVRQRCILSEKLSHFNVTSGFPPDIVHDLFEGIVPMEIARCLSVFTSKKYFTLAFLNEAILTFPFKWTDKTNRPHSIPPAYSAKKTIGGNCHENWSLIRFFPILVGQKVPADEPAWNLLTDLKDIVDLAVTPFHTKESIAYLNFKIMEHRSRFKELFPDANLLPKHHFLEHYPELIIQFGPLASLWTLRFEAKHSFLKRVVKHTTCFKNVLKTLAEKHQFHMAQQLYVSSVPERLLVANVTFVSIDLLKEDIAQAVKLKQPDLQDVCFTNNVTYDGTTYRMGMILPHDSLSGLPEFTEIIHMIVNKDKLLFVVRKLCSWYQEYYRAYELKVCPTKAIDVLEPKDLTDSYPLVDYRVGGMRLVVLKRYIHI